MRVLTHAVTVLMRRQQRLRRRRLYDILTHTTANIITAQTHAQLTAQYKNTKYNPFRARTSFRLA